MNDLNSSGFEELEQDSFITPFDGDDVAAEKFNRKVEADTEPIAEDSSSAQFEDLALSVDRKAQLNASFEMV